MILQNKCDVHTHTLFSRHAYSTVMENAAAANARGLELLGSTDHYSAMLFPDYRNNKNYQYLSCEKDWPRWIGNLCLLRGCEVDIVTKDGGLFGEDIPVEEGITGDLYRDGKSRNLYTWVTGEMDYVIASVHGQDFALDLDEAGNTELYLGALRKEKVLILGHIGRTGLRIDLDEILKEAKRLHKLIEFNEHSFDSPGAAERCRKIAVRCAELGVSVTVSTDAHFCMRVGKVERTLQMLQEVHFPQDLIVTRDRESFLRAVREGGVCDRADLPE